MVQAYSTQCTNNSTCQSSFLRPHNPVNLQHASGATQLSTQQVHARSPTTRHTNSTRQGRTPQHTNSTRRVYIARKTNEYMASRAIQPNTRTVHVVHVGSARHINKQYTVIQDTWSGQVREPAITENDSYLPRAARP